MTDTEALAILEKCDAWISWHPFLPNFPHFNDLGGLNVDGALTLLELKALIHLWESFDKLDSPFK